MELDIPEMTIDQLNCKKLIYIAGPYRAPTVNGIHNNIAEARKRMEWAWGAGYVPICPHTNSAFTDGLVSDTIILAGCLKLLSVCDVILLMRGWRNSEGAVRERELAIQFGLEIINDPL
jgi:hypothetical protein